MREVLPTPRPHSQRDVGDVNRLLSEIEFKYPRSAVQTFGLLRRWLAGVRSLPAGAAATAHTTFALAAVLLLESFQFLVAEFAVAVRVRVGEALEQALAIRAAKART